MGHPAPGVFFAWLVVSANHKRLWDLEDKPASAWALLKHADKRKTPSRFSRYSSPGNPKLKLDERVGNG
jgi:hypothetical protein